MQDRIEQFIRENRAEFDVHEPRPQLWDNIADNLLQHRQHGRWRMAAIAASLFLVVIASTWVTMYVGNKRNVVNTQAHAPQSEAKNAEIYYTSLVAEKQQELNKYASAQPQLYGRFRQDLVDLQASYARLKKEYAATPEKEVVLHAMIENLQLQTHIIELQLNIIKEIPAHNAADTTTQPMI